MAFKPIATSSELTKRYLWLAANWGQQFRLWVYVTTDSGPTVAASGYITDQSFIDTMETGDFILVLEVGSISDAREVTADVGTGGLVDLTLHIITENNGTTVDLSDDVLGGVDPVSVNYDTRADLVADEVASNVNHIRTAGYAILGDGGEALYKRVAAEPSHDLKANSADGAWWEIVPATGTIGFQACGGVEGDLSANGATNVTAFNNFIDYVQTFDAVSLYVGGLTLNFLLGIIISIHT